MRWIGVIVAALVAVGCKDTKPSTPAPVPGATMVRGTERLAWSQSGDLAGLTFRAYVDGLPVPLAAATCDSATPEANCSSPLPPLTDGVHTIALAAVLAAANLESDKTEPLTLQKVSGTTSSVAALPDAFSAVGLLGLQPVVNLTDTLAYTADIVARDVHAPAQLAWLPDGRLLLSEAHGRLRFVRPGLPPESETSIDADTVASLLRPPPSGALGIAAHPDFSANHWLYAAFLSDDGPGRYRLHVARLREVADTIGEPAVLFEAPVIATGHAGAVVAVPATLDQPAKTPAPRLAFGPDALLYVALPPGFTFDREPAASRPHPSLLRMTDDGRVPPLAPLAGVSAHPLGFAWDPATGALLMALPSTSATADIRPVAQPRAPVPTRAGANVRVGLTSVRARKLSAPASTSMVASGNDRALADLVRVLTAAGKTGAARVIRLNAPLAITNTAGETLTRIGDAVSTSDGTWLAVTTHGTSAGGDEDDGNDFVVRMK